MGVPQRSAALTTDWFALPALSCTDGLTASVAGKAAGATVAFEFGRARRPATSMVAPLGEFVPSDPPPPDLNSQLGIWRAVTVEAAQIPAGADRVRLRVKANGGGADWIAITGPRSNSVIRLTDYLSGRGPVLLNWQQSFVFPCVHDIARVADGLARTPRVAIVTGGPWFTEPQDQHLAGVFAGLQPFGQLYQVPTRLPGYPDGQWGALLVSGAKSVDGYDTRLDDVRRPGHGDRHRLYQVDLPP